MMEPRNIGELVTWLYTPRGGYGYRIPVDGVVTKFGPRRVQIEVQHYSGRKRIWVTLENLRLRVSGDAAS